MIAALCQTDSISNLTSGDLLENLKNWWRYYYRGLPVIRYGSGRV